MDNQFAQRYSQPPQEETTSTPPQQPRPAAYSNPPQKNGGGFFKYLLIFLLIAAIGAGVYFWQQSKVKQSDKRVTDLRTQLDSVSAQFANLKNDVSSLSSGSDASTVAMKELGLQLTVPGSLKDLTYKVIDVNYKKPTNTLANYPTAYLSTKSLDGLESGKCLSTAFKLESVPPLGYLTKTTGQYPKAATADSSTGTLIKQYPTYYVAYRAPASGCFTDAKNNATAKKLSDQLVLVLNPVIEKQ